MAANINYVMKWDVELAAVPVGAGPMTVTDQQRIKITQGSPLAGGMVYVTSTGNYPTSTNITNALTTVATNAGLALNGAAATAVWQGWYLGNG